MLFWNIRLDIKKADVSLIFIISFLPFFCLVLLGGGNDVFQRLF